MLKCRLHSTKDWKRKKKKKKKNSLFFGRRKKEDIIFKSRAMRREVLGRGRGGIHHGNAGSRELVAGSLISIKLMPA